MRRPIITLVFILAVFGISLSYICYDVLANGSAMPPEKRERDPARWQTYRPHVNLGIAQREAGQYNKALQSLLYVNMCAPKGSRVWLVATINLAMACEVLGHDHAADQYYRDAGKFCLMASNMRSGGDWRKLRRKIEEDNRKAKENKDASGR